jgi:hypothetical protein
VKEERKWDAEMKVVKFDMEWWRGGDAEMLRC